LWGSKHGAASVNTSVTVPSNAPGGLATLAYTSLPLGVGDELTIRIVDAGVPDMPSTRNDGDGRIIIESGASE
jgi:hypothetical protein